ncbi:hypothetical protein [uncultured Chitinophaga sp.]|uniref:hypothetical protein n=1 Tax=uncultured Chitinophaga sp. TaxID=339340 RepID=UPI0025DF22A3|nr:hypothetical protein [uncultured Chitinophaga sp.]
MKNMLFLAGLALLAISCANNTKPEAAMKDTVITTATVKYDTLMVANKTDPFCGMSLASGVNDTAHYNNAVLGFCSSSCKDGFLADAGKYPVEMK